MENKREGLQARRNELSKQIGQAKAAKDEGRVQSLMAELVILKEGLAKTQEHEVLHRKLGFRLEMRSGIRVKVEDGGGVGTATTDEMAMYDMLLSLATPSPSTDTLPKPDWLNAATCIENAQIAYDDSTEDEDGPVDTVISSGDLGVLIGLAEYAVAMRAQHRRHP